MWKSRASGGGLLLLNPPRVKTELAGLHASVMPQLSTATLEMKAESGADVTATKITFDFNARNLLTWKYRFLCWRNKDPPESPTQKETRWRDNLMDTLRWLTQLSDLYRRWHPDVLCFHQNTWICQVWTHPESHRWVCWVSALPSPHSFASAASKLVPDQHVLYVLISLSLKIQSNRHSLDFACECVLLCVRVSSGYGWKRPQSPCVVVTPPLFTQTSSTIQEASWVLCHEMLKSVQCFYFYSPHSL